ncbi:GntR family transcriptional regulator [Anaerocolumna jejuensis]|uniref:GntR family transcriptional regulator n=1 Tax=Anaerocolumna jejuensis TaxID=259063 RepID=UPI003F7C6BFB
MKSQSIKNQVYEGILKDILDGVYQANAIINEKALIDKYNVSKTPVREALVQLCSEGILKNIPRFGYQLSMITPSEIIEMIEFRKIIEVGALEMSFDRLTASHLEELKELNRQAENISKSQDIKVHWEANQMFHRKLCSFCGNRYLQKSLDDSLNFCTRIANQYFVKVWESNEAEDGDHFKIVNSIENKNLEYAKEILIYDIELMKNKIL